MQTETVTSAVTNNLLVSGHDLNRESAFKKYLQQPNPLFFFKYAETLVINKCRPAL